MYTDDLSYDKSRISASLRRTRIVNTSHCEVGCMGLETIYVVEVGRGYRYVTYFDFALPAGVTLACLRHGASISIDHEFTSSL
jgi:hypothetical protein